MQFGIPIEQLVRLNQLQDSRIYIGQQLVIPEERNAQYYYVQPGDSLYSLSQRFETTVEGIRRINNLPSYTIYIGQRLKISDEDERQTEYKVKAGDSLYSIASRYNTTVESIMTLNNLESMNLTVGQTLRIPVYSEVIVNVNSANIRQRPGETFPVIAQMDQGARLPLLGVQGDWYRVALFNGNPGWVSKTVTTLTCP